MGFRNIFERILEIDDSSEIRKIEPLLNDIEKEHNNVKSLTEQELKKKTEEFVSRIEKGEELEEILPEAFAVVKEACKRVIGLDPYPVQQIGGMIIHQGRIAEMKTGEGKTLVALFPAYLNALTKKGVHIATVNEYLADRDSREMGQVFEYIGLTVGCIKSTMQTKARQMQYSCDITYSTATELGFDYLRDNLVKDKNERVHRSLNYVIIDEADSILIDEARTPLIIASMMGEASQFLYFIDSVIKTFIPDTDFEIVEREKSIFLTEAGIDKCEDIFKLNNLMDVENIETYHRILQSLRANFIMRRDVDYVVVKNDQGKDEVVIIDPNTGRLMFGRRYTDGLHQAIEAKEKIEIQKQSKTLATITFQSLFRMYNKLSGMTGTGVEAEEELKKMYNLDVVAIPTNAPIQRIDMEDVLLKTEKAKFNTCVSDIEERHKMGQPVLVGTASVEKSESLSKLLTKKKISHKVLNAKNYKEEADIIKMAGQKGAVTISTNMAGRGVDIKLGEGVAELGGLHVIGTLRHESLRIDNQLRGRSGRQGDVGSSIFYISFEDELMQRFSADDIIERLNKIGYEDDDIIEDKRLTKAIESAQKQVELKMYNARKRIFEFDEVINTYRDIIYKKRNEVLEKIDLKSYVIEAIEQSVTETVKTYCNDLDSQNRDVIGMIFALRRKFPKQVFDINCLDTVTPIELSESIADSLTKSYEEKEKLHNEKLRDYERSALLISIDINWIEFLETVEELKSTIGFRGMANQNPIDEYRKETSLIFDNTIKAIGEDTVRILWRSLED